MSVNIQYIQQEVLKILNQMALPEKLSQEEMDECWQQLNQLQVLSQVEIASLDFKGTTSPLDESITIRNRGDMTADISGWHIQAGSPDQQYIFPEHTFLSPFEYIKIDTSGKSEHSFGSNQPVWNNRGDLGTLVNHHGQTVSSFIYGDKAHPHAIISHVNYDGKEFRSEGDEYVEIHNTSEYTVDLSQWRLEALLNDNCFVFPEDTQLAPLTSLRVFTNKASLEDNEYSFNSPTALWNNDGGGCKLIDYQDREVSSYNY
ncbi:lamin tail domain-containing protein [Vibrio coralliilyticus]|uniref:lamin tail domain-containing protein n=1 Tax=Vibrio coralliilyticus TaxID=190893 RepID=UPI001E4CC6BA|nr:lamin tail domain-containing protein [Vibrio coralliilyticus]MCC2521579.1 lamin tail domain-containing protein [Vibrio coralliilyticus]